MGKLLERFFLSSGHPDACEGKKCKNDVDNRTSKGNLNSFKRTFSIKSILHLIRIDSTLFLHPCHQYIATEWQYTQLPFDAVALPGSEDGSEANRKDFHLNSIPPCHQKMSKF